MELEQMPPDGQVQMILLMTMLAIFSLVGTIGNGLVIFVFQRVREKSTSQMFMIFLAFIDFLTCVVSIPLTMYMEYMRYKVDSDFLCKVYHFMVTSKIPLSACIMMLIAVDRYFCICHPLKRSITILRARLIIAAVILTASTFGIISSFFFSVHTEVDKLDYRRIFEIIGHKFAEIVQIEELDGDSKSALLQIIVAHEVIKANMTVKWDVNNTLPYKLSTLNSGSCNITYLVFSQEMWEHYQIVYNAVFPLCLLAVIILYLNIYRFMCRRRSKKLKQRLKMCSYVNQDSACSNGANGPVIKDDERGLMTELSALSHIPSSQIPNVENDTDVGESAARCLKETPPQNNIGTQYLSTKMPNTLLVTKGLSSSCHALNAHNQKNSNSSCITKLALSASNSRSQITGSPTSGMVSPTFSSVTTNTNMESVDNKNGGSHSCTNKEPKGQSKCRWYRKRDSVKRYKGKKHGWRKDGQLSSSNHSKDYDPSRLREENRMANAKTALMLFTVSIVFAIAFGPAWLMTLQIIDYHRVVFYLYFSYNAANPFIYAFMNQIFKAYMRNIFSCTQKTIIVVSS